MSAARRRKNEDISEWTVTIHHVDYETGEELDMSKFSSEEIARRKKIILDRAFAKIGYLPVEESQNRKYTALTECGEKEWENRDDKKCNIG